MFSTVYTDILSQPQLSVYTILSIIINVYTVNLLYDSIKNFTHDMNLFDIKPTEIINLKKLLLEQKKCILF